MRIKFRLKGKPKFLQKLKIIWLVHILAKKLELDFYDQELLYDYIVQHHVLILTEFDKNVKWNSYLRKSLEELATTIAKLIPEIVIDYGNTVESLTFNTDTTMEFKTSFLKGYVLLISRSNKETETNKIMQDA